MDACIDDIAAGRRSVEECLSAYPRERERLAEVLGAAQALDRLPRIPEGAVGPARRAELMAQLRSTPQLPQDAPVAPRVRAGGLGWAGAVARGLAGALAAPFSSLPSMARAGAVAVPVAAAAVIAVVLVLSTGGSTAQASTLTVFGGAVERATGDGWAVVEDGAGIEEGDRLRTDAAGEAVLTFADGTAVTIGPESELVVAAAGTPGDGSEGATGGAIRGGIRIEQVRGSLWNDVAPRTGSAEGSSDGEAFTIETADAVVTALGTLFKTDVDGETTVTAAEGSVRVLAGDEVVVVSAGQRTVARRLRIVEAVRDARTSETPQLGLTVEGPFAVTLVAPDGRATGVRPDGVVFHQIPGAALSISDAGVQALEVLEPPDGRYTLLLRRVGAGAGELVLSAGGQERRVPLVVRRDALLLQLRLSTVGGRLVVTPERVLPLSDEALARLRERVVVTDVALERARDVAERLSQLSDRQSDRAGDAPTETPTDAPSDRPGDGLDGAGSGEGGDRSSDGTREAGTPSDGATDTREPTPEATRDGASDGATASPTGTSTVEPVRDATPEGSATAVGTPSDGGDRARD